MPKANLRLCLRNIGNSLVRRIPRSLLRMFLKSFADQPELAEAAGFHVHPRRFDSPLPIMEEIDAARLSAPRLLPGIDLRIAAALILLKELHRFAPELDPIPYERNNQSSFWFDNGTFTDFDAAVLYGMLRYLKPKRYVELGCGFSSILSSRALRQNQQEGSFCDALYCDPEPRLELRDVIEHGSVVLKRVQDLNLEIFRQMRRGDVLFIDTSHVLKIQSDVEHELLRILPSLEAGVWIHFHDVFTPYDYPNELIFRSLRLALNEQYAVECLLTGGNRYQVELPLHCLVRECSQSMREFFPRGRNRGQSMWLRKVQ